MSSDVIQVDFEVLNQIAQRFGQQAESTAHLINLIHSRLAPLQDGGWQGQGADAFFAEMEKDLLPGLQRLQFALEQASQTTDIVGQVLDEAQQEGASRFDPAGSGGNGMSPGGRVPGVPGSGFPSGPGNGFPGDIGDLIGSSPGTPIINIGNNSGNIIINIINEYGYGAGTDPLAGQLPGGNDYGIPVDWLSGVTSSLGSGAGSSSGEFIPNNWLEGVLGNMEGQPLNPDSGGASMGGESGSSSGGGSGGGSATDTAVTEPTSPPETPSSSGGSGGSSSPPTDIRSPNSPLGSGFQGTSAAPPAAPASSGSFAYQGGSSGGGTAVPPETAGSGFTAVSAAPTAPAPAEGGNAAIALGLAAATPFLGILGKLINGERNN